MKTVVVLLTFLLAAPVFAGDEQYKLGPDSMRQEGVPCGKVTKFDFRGKIFSGTARDYWVYVPAQYDGEKPACVMVFQDGYGYVDVNRGFRVPIVFDNLIHKGQMPVTIGVFINPGRLIDPPSNAPGAASNRNFEYDSLSDLYARFLMEEILPEVGKQYKLTDDPECRAICGMSSGGICAFTVAWQRPDAFRKVLSHVGSFTNIRGGHAYPSLIRSTENKPIRVFLQGGSNDLDNEYGNWWLANLQMEAALKFKKYDYKFAGGTGKHSGKHGGSILPDSLRWLWRKPDAQPTAENQQQIQEVLDSVIKKCKAKGRNPGHGFPVLKTAQAILKLKDRIPEMRAADPQTAQVAALLHDIGGGGAANAKPGAVITRDILKEMKYDPAAARRIERIVETHHVTNNVTVGVDDSPEWYVVLVADTPAVVRLFASASAPNAPAVDEKVLLQKINERIAQLKEQLAKQQRSAETSPE